MFGHGAKADWNALEGKAEALEPVSRAALEILRDAATKLPDGDSVALAGLLKHQVEKRLQIKADRHANPDIEHEAIRQPIIIIGMGRSGTSLLHSMLAADPDNRAPRSWELMTPSPPAPDEAETARRMALSSDAVQAFVAATPDILKLHPYWDEVGGASVECEDIMQMSLLSLYFTAFFNVPDYDRWLTTADFGPAYRAHLEFLQHLQCNAPRRRWVLKGVQHFDHLDLLLKTYPDACLVWPHRDPVDQIASLCATVAVTRRVNDAKSLHEIYRSLADNTARGLDAALGHPATRDGRILHVPFSRLSHDPKTVVAEIYAKIGSSVTAAHARAMTDWLSSPQNDPARHGRISNDLARFGASIEEVRERFAAYLASGLVGTA